HAPRNDDGKASGMFIARSTNLGKQETDFAGGYCISGSGGQSEFPRFALEAKGYGQALKEAVRKDYPAYARLYMSAGDMLPREDNYVELDPEVKDAWGMPALRIVCSHSDNERRLFRHGLQRIQ